LSSAYAFIYVAAKEGKDTFIASKRIDCFNYISGFESVSGDMKSTF